MAFDANKTYLRVGTDPNSKVKKIDGKGLGWVANKDMKRGSVIFTENPQLELSLDSSVDMKRGSVIFTENPQLELSLDSSVGNQSCKI